MGIKLIQTNFTAGVLDPLTAGREDTEMYYNGLASARNLIVQPVGGIVTRHYLKKVMRLPKKFDAIDLASAVISTPNGGVLANLRDGNEETYFTNSANLAATNNFVIVSLDLVTAKLISAIDVVNYKLSSGLLDNEIIIQYSLNNSDWFNYGTAFNWSADVRTRRRRALNVTARYIRIIRIGVTNLAAAASIGELRLWSESSTKSAARLAPFAQITEDAYMMVVTEKNMDILVGDDRVGSITIPHVEAQLPVLNWTQSKDTMLLFHVDQQPFRLFQQGANDEFDSRKQVFENLPKYDYGAGVGGVNEVQTLNHGQTISAGDKFTILLEGRRTPTITILANDTLTAAAIQTALRGLDNTSVNGIVVTFDTDSFIVTFTGDDGNQPWQEMDVSVMSGDGVWTISRKTEGEYPGEDIVSDARGWFRCGQFYQKRLWMGGAKSCPNGAIASRPSEFFDFDTTIDNDSAGLFFPLETNKVSKIFQIVAGRQLSIFTSDAEFYIAKEPIAADAVIKQTTSVGVKEGLRVHDMDGALEYIQGDGASLREFLYNYDEQSIQSNNLSYKAGFLIKSPVDVDLRRAVNADETDQLYIVNGDGTMALMCALRSQSVPGAFTELDISNGQILAVGADAKKRVYIVTERQIGNSVERFVERFDDEATLDCSTKIIIEAEETTASAGQTVFSYTFTSPVTDAEVGVRLNGARLNSYDYVVDRANKKITLLSPTIVGEKVRLAKMIKTVSNVEDMDGAKLLTIVDGILGDEVLVSGGAFTMSDYADTSIEYGFDYDAEGELLPPRIPGQQTLTGKKVRVPRVILSLYETECIEIAVSGGKYREVPLVFLDDETLDKTQAQLRFTGVRDLRGLLGWGDGSLKFRRPRPGKMNIRTITREVST